MAPEPLKRRPARGRPSPPQIPGYRIEGILGRGATGVVYRARQLSVDRPVALKVLHAASVRSERVIQRLEREARTAALLAHPSIISAIDMGRVGGIWWFAMELVEGPSLAERLEHGGRLSERDALRLFVPLADALQHACEKGVVHRDVKPANILLEPGGRPRLVDLGLARVDDDPALTRSGGTLGTPFYISPEQARDPAQTDIRGDIWSLGATLFHAVCGRPPFSGQGAAEILSNVLYAPVPDPRRVRPELSRGLSLVIRKCLSRDLERRYFTPAELREDMERIQGHRAPAIREAHLEPTAESGERVRRAFVAGGALAALALVVALLIWRPWRTETPTPVAEPAVASAYEPLERVAADLVDPGRDLAGAYHLLQQLEERVPRAERARWGELYAELHAALRDELHQHRRELEPALGRALSERRFRTFENLLEREEPLRLGERTGFSHAGLPGALRTGLEQWRLQWSLRGEEARAAAITGIVDALRRFTEGLLWPRIDRLQAEGRWDEAHAELSGGPWAHLEEAGAELGELSREDLEPALAELGTRIERRLVELEGAWRALDQELARRVRELAAEAEERLIARHSIRAVAEYESALAAELARVQLSLESWPGPPLRSQTPELHQRKREALLELEEELLAEDARRLFAAAESEAANWMRERRFERARRFWVERGADPALLLLRDHVELRAQEAALLAQLLDSAARGVGALTRSGESLRLRLGSIRHAGRVDAGSNPLEDGFLLWLAGGSGDPQRLRLVGPADTQSGGTRLPAAALEQLAGHDPELEEDVDHHLARALLRFHEGDPEGARALLEAEDLPADDRLVHDLALRIEQMLGESEAWRARRRTYAARRLDELDVFLQRSSRRRGIELVQELLGEYGDVLGSEEARGLRERLRGLKGSGAPAGREDFQLVFGPDEVELRGDRARMRWLFDEVEVGAWLPGVWRYDGRGWAASSAVDDLEALARMQAPTLSLPDPLVVGRGVTELVLELEQIWPARLLVVSLCGFHVALAGTGVEGGAHIVVDTGRLQTAALRASGGQGTQVTGLREGEQHRLLLRANPSRGTIEVRLDGRVLLSQATLSPRGGPRTPSVSVRSSEPLRLISAELEASR